MLLSSIVLGAFLLAPVILIGGLFFIDRKLRVIDKSKYFEKSLKKQLKKGTLTETEYQEQMGNLHLK